jgi:MOSC domain-containing protein
MLSSLHLLGQADSRRFRPNLVIETPEETEGLVENDWVGCTTLIGSDVRLRVSNPTSRCVAPTLRQG